MRKTSALPISKPILIHNLLAKELRLREPLAVSLDYDESQVIAYRYDLDVPGYGETEIEALNDLRQTVVDLYFMLKESEHALGGYAEEVWKYLRPKTKDQGLRTKSLYENPALAKWKLCRRPLQRPIRRAQESPPTGFRTDSKDQ